MLIKNIGANAWVDINTISTIEVGKRFKIFNVSNVPVLLVTSSLEPNITAEDGVIALPGRCIIVEAGDYSVWARTISGYQNAEVFVQETKPYSLTDNGLDPRVYSGLQGITTQPFTEANVKNGTQFSISYEVAVPVGAKAYASIKTPPEDNILIKTRLVSTDGGMRYHPRAGAVFTPDATVIPSFNLNGQSSNTSNVIANTVTAGNITNLGVSFDVIRSASGTGSNREQGIFGTEGIERVLGKDTFYLLEFENLDNKQIYVIYSVTWYEGPLSTDLL